MVECKPVTNIISHTIVQLIINQTISVYIPDRLLGLIGALATDDDIEDGDNEG